MRLDLYLSKNFDIQSRNKALELILSNKVRVDGKIVSKASFLVDEKMKIELLEEDFYVSRAAYKLKYFLDLRIQFLNSLFHKYRNQIIHFLQDMIIKYVLHIQF